MRDDLSRTDRLWLGAHGDERYASEWAELQQREDDQAAIERTKIMMRQYDEAGIPYEAISTWGYVDPIAVYRTDGK